jgi:hypothetical protein
MVMGGGVFVCECMYVSLSVCVTQIIFKKCTHSHTHTGTHLFHGFEKFPYFVQTLTHTQKYRCVCVCMCVCVSVYGCVVRGWLLLGCLGIEGRVLEVCVKYIYSHTNIKQVFIILYTHTHKHTY